MRYFADNSAAVLVGRSAPVLAAAAKRAWSTVTAPVRGFVQREAVYRELSELDDRMLADIGLNRADVYAVANGLRRADGTAPKRTA
jgi:uncharacterized protein YjiS (DUF1127 family)